MTDDAAMQARVAELQRRRAARSAPQQVASDAASTDASADGARATKEAPARNPRATAAQASKVAAAGVGFATMLGLVAVMSYADRSSEATPQVVPTPDPPAPVVIVVHPAGATSDAAPVPAEVKDGASTSEPIPVSAQPAQQPTVQQAPASQAPTAQTNGSR